MHTSFPPCSPSLSALGTKDKHLYVALFYCDHIHTQCTSCVTVKCKSLVVTVNYVVWLHHTSGTSIECTGKSIQVDHLVNCSMSCLGQGCGLGVLSWSVWCADVNFTLVITLKGGLLSWHWSVHKNDVCVCVYTYKCVCPHTHTHTHTHTRTYTQQSVW